AWTGGVNISLIEKISVGIGGLPSGLHEFTFDSVEAGNLHDFGDRTRELLKMIPIVDTPVLLEDFETIGDWLAVERPAGADPSGTTIFVADTTTKTEGSRSITVKSDIVEGEFGVEKVLSPPLDFREATTLLLDNRNVDGSGTIWVELEDGTGVYLSTLKKGIVGGSFDEHKFDIESGDFHMDFVDVTKLRIMFDAAASGVAPNLIECGIDNLRTSTENTREAGYFFA
ncbi:hypothetical protein LCGC14_2621960, partial [marine sediment metagenome]